MGVEEKEEKHSREKQGLYYTFVFTYFPFYFVLVSGVQLSG